MPRTRVDDSREQKVAELVAAAAELFAERGFAATTTASIARAAGVSERTLFWYFESEDHLLIGVLRSEFDRLIGGLRASGRPNGDLADDRYRLLLAMREVRHLLAVVHERTASATSTTKRSGQCATRCWRRSRRVRRPLDSSPGSPAAPAG